MKPHQTIEPITAAFEILISAFYSHSRLQGFGWLWPNPPWAAYAAPDERAPLTKLVATLALLLR
jgi:hypothetical protein